MYTKIITVQVIKMFKILASNILQNYPSENLLRKIYQEKELIFCSRFTLNLQCKYNRGKIRGRIYLNFWLLHVIDFISIL